jgi:hypothetical protein
LFCLISEEPPTAETYLLRANLAIFLSSILECWFICFGETYQTLYYTDMLVEFYAIEMNLKRHTISIITLQGFGGHQKCFYLTNKWLFIFKTVICNFLCNLSFIKVYCFSESFQHTNWYYFLFCNQQFSNTFLSSQILNFSYSSQNQQTDRFLYPNLFCFTKPLPKTRPIFHGLKSILVKWV